MQQPLEVSTNRLAVQEVAELASDRSGHWLFRTNLDANGKVRHCCDFYICLSFPKMLLFGSGDVHQQLALVGLGYHHVDGLRGGA